MAGRWCATRRNPPAEAWDLADLLYKLFCQQFQGISFVKEPEGRYPVRLLLAIVVTANS